MNILIVGGAGFVGANLVRYCLEQPGARVTVFDSLEPKLKASDRHLAPVRDKIAFIRGSMLDDGAIGEAVKGQQIVFNCAGQSSHPLSLADPVYDTEINCIGNLKLLEAMRRHNPEATVVYASSSTAIGKAARDVIDETHGEDPLEVYSANKGVSDKYYRIYHRVHGLKTVALRFANLFGPYGKGLPEFGFLNYFIHLAWTGETIRIFGDGAQLRNVLYVEDACAAMWTAAMTPGLLGGIYFAVHEEHRTVREIAETIVRVMERGGTEFVPWPPERKAIEVERQKISAAKFRSLTGWQPRYSFAEGLARTKNIMESEKL